MFECQWCNERFYDISRIDHVADGFFEREDHEHLAELLQVFYMEFPEPDIIITYDNHPYICQLYSLIVSRRYFYGILGKRIFGKNRRK